MKKAQIFGALTLAAGATLSLILFTSPQASAERPGECICTDEYDPVCILETGQKFSNDCRAQCAGFTPDEYAECSF